MIAAIDASEVRRLAERFAPAPSDPRAVLIPKAKMRWSSVKVPGVMQCNDDAACGSAQRELGRIMPIIGDQFGVLPEVLLGRGREQWIINARFMAYAHLRERGYSLKLIAKIMRRRDHASVFRGLQRWQTHMDTLREFRAAWKKFSKEVNRV